MFTLLLSLSPHENCMKLFEFTDEEIEAQRDPAMHPAQTHSQQVVEARREPRQPDSGAHTLKVTLPL